MGSEIVLDGLPDSYCLFGSKGHLVVLMEH